MSSGLCPRIRREPGRQEAERKATITFEKVHGKPLKFPKLYKLVVVLDILEGGVDPRGSISPSPR